MATTFHPDTAAQLRKLSEDELDRLDEFIHENGRAWRSKLRQAWSRGDSTLRETRNTIGPSGLDKLRIPRACMRKG